MKYLSAFIHSMDAVRGRPMLGWLAGQPANTLETVFGVWGKDYAVYLADERELADPRRGRPHLRRSGLCVARGSIPDRRVFAGDRPVFAVAYRRGRRSPVRRARIPARHRPAYSGGVGEANWAAPTGGKQMKNVCRYSMAVCLTIAFGVTPATLAQAPDTGHGRPIQPAAAWQRKPRPAVARFPEHVPALRGGTRRRALSLSYVVLRVGRRRHQSQPSRMRRCPPRPVARLGPLGGIRRRRNVGHHNGPHALDAGTRGKHAVLRRVAQRRSVGRVSRRHVLHGLQRHEQTLRRTRQRPSQHDAAVHHGRPVARRHPLDEDGPSRCLSSRRRSRILPQTKAGRGTSTGPA